MLTVARTDFRTLDIVADIRNVRRLSVSVVLPLLALLTLASCGSTGSSSLARHSSESLTAGRNGGPNALGFTGQCLSVRISKRNSRRNGGVGPRPTRSCPSTDLHAVLRVMAQLHRALGGSGTICPLLTEDYRQNAQRWAHRGHLTCDRALLSSTGSPTDTRTRLSHPVSSIIFFYSYRGVAAIVGLRRPPHGATGARLAEDTINVVMARESDGEWQIGQIGYEF